MRRAGVCTFFIFVLSLSLMFVMEIKEGKAEDTTVVYVDPPVSYVSLGQTFSINVSIANVTDLYGYEFALSYNSTILKVTEVVIQPFLNKPTWPWMKNKEGHVWVCDCSYRPAAPTSGSGTLVTITFNVIGTGDCEIDLGVPNASCAWEPGTKLARVRANSNVEKIPHVSKSGHVRFRPPKRDIVVFLDAPNHLLPGDSALLKATVLNSGQSTETDVELRLLIDGNITSFEVIRYMQGGLSYSLSYLWTPPLMEATYNVTACVSLLPEENDITNNEKSARVVVSYVIQVPFHYLKIQDAIDVASLGDVIVVLRGTYYECLTIDKSVTLTGQANNTIIDGGGNNEVIGVTANNVRISNLTIQNGLVGIYLHDVKYTVISGNTVRDTSFGGAGILVEDSHNNLINGNTILNNHYGISLTYSCSGNTITNNTMMHNDVDIDPTESSKKPDTDTGTDEWPYASPKSAADGGQLETISAHDSAESSSGSLTEPWTSIVVLIILAFAAMIAGALHARRH